MLLDGMPRISNDTYNLRIKAHGVREAMATADFFAHLDAEAKRRDCTKQILYVADESTVPWLEAGFRREATIEGFYPQGVDAVIWSRFLDQKRSVPGDAERLAEVEALARSKDVERGRLPAGYVTRGVEVDDAPRLSALLRTIFPDYPTPLDEDHLAELIASGRSHFAVAETESGELAAVISAEIDAVNGNAEVSDCATLPAHRGQGLLRHLIARAESAVWRLRGIESFYTLARGCEPGVNIAFARNGYHCTGTLINNCRMPSGWESMRAWCKHRKG